MSETVLLVDDDENDRFFIQRTLKKLALPLEIRMASDGSEAIAYFQGEGEFADRNRFPLVRAVREVQKGNAYFSPTIAERLRAKSLAKLEQPLQTAKSALTSRESEVLQLIAEGFSNKQIAGELNISIKTIEKHRQSLMNKLGIHSIAGLTRHAAGSGVIEASSAKRVLAHTP